MLEPAAIASNADEPMQFERLGYFRRDRDSAPGKPVFVRTVGLRDTFAKTLAKGIGASSIRQSRLRRISANITLGCAFVGGAGGRGGRHTIRGKVAGAVSRARAAMAAPVRLARRGSRRRAPEQLSRRSSPSAPGSTGLPLPSAPARLSISCCRASRCFGALLGGALVFAIVGLRRLSARHVLAARHRHRRSARGRDGGKIPRRPAASRRRSNAPSSLISAAA